MREMRGERVEAPAGVAFARVDGGQRQEVAMARIELKPQEAAELAEVLSMTVSDLRMEIAGTDSQAMREELKEREVFLKRLVAELKAPPEVDH